MVAIALKETRGDAVAITGSYTQADNTQAFLNAEGGLAQGGGRELFSEQED